MSNKYDNSRPINLWMTSDSPKFQTVISLLINQIKKELNDNHSLIRFREPVYQLALKHLAADLFLCYQEDKSKYLGYSRNKATYASSSRYDPKHLSFKPLMNIVTALDSLANIESTKGFQDLKSKVSRLSRIRATDTFLKLFDGLSASDFYQLPSKECIILKSTKDAQGKAIKVDYGDTQETFHLRQNLHLINERINEQDIKLQATDQQLIDLNTDLKSNGETSLNYLSTNLARVFNNNSFEQGGRFYGGWWLSIPSKYRQLIRINGKRTSEIDYSTIHFTMLYADKGLDLPYADLYTIDGLERKKVKLALNTALNAKSKKDAISAIKANQFPEKTKAEVESILDIILQEHQPIQEYFYTGKGIELQFKDSQVAEDVMLSMWDNWKEVVLPVHDSFIVSRGLISQLKEQMNKSFKKITGSDCRLELVVRDGSLMNPMEKLASRVEYDNKGNITGLGVNAAGTWDAYLELKTLNKELDQ